MFDRSDAGDDIMFSEYAIEAMAKFNTHYGEMQKLKEELKDKAKHLEGLKTFTSN